MDVINNSEKINEAAEITVPAEEKEQKKKSADKPDKLAVLRAKQKKAAEAAEKATEKVKAVEAEIAAEEKKRHDKDIKRLDILCGKLQIDFTDIIGLIEIMSANNLTVADVADLISK